MCWSRFGRKNLCSRRTASRALTRPVTSSVFLGLNTTYFVELYDGTNAEIVEESSISSIIPNGTKVKLTLKQDKINVFTADGKTNLTKGVVNDVR